MLPSIVDVPSVLSLEKLAVLRAIALMSPRLGASAEVGVFNGGSLRVIAQARPHTLCVGIDTFTGMPESAWREEEPHKPGEFRADFEAVKSYLRDLGNVCLLQGTFPDVMPEETDPFILQEPEVWGMRETANRRWEPLSNLPGGFVLNYAFVHIDADYYQSTKDAISYFRSRMTLGGIILLDDYGWPKTPGVKKAAAESRLNWLQISEWQAIARF